MLILLVAVEATFFQTGIKIPHGFFTLGEICTGIRGIALIAPYKEDEGAESRAQRTHTTQQQCKNVEQAFGCSGDQCFLGHRFVPRIGLFAPDDSTNGGRAMHRRLARLAGALIPAFDQEELHAVGY
jgi:hypothetical protein